MIKPEIILRQAKDVSGAIKNGNDLGLLALVTNIVTEAKDEVKVKTSLLKNSIMGRASNKEYGYEGGPKLRARTKSGEAIVGTSVLYGIYQEFGTRYMAAQPYLRPAIAIQANGQKVKDVIKKYTNKELTEEIKRAWETRKFK